MHVKIYGFGPGGGGGSRDFGQPVQGSAFSLLASMGGGGGGTDGTYAGLAPLMVSCKIMFLGVIFELANPSN